MRPFENRRVLVTGSARGIGKEIARRFAQGSAKIQLVACSRDELDRTWAVMSVSTVRLVRSLLKKHAIRRAYLGTVFTLSMSRITFIEDLSTVIMSAAMVAADLLHA